MNYSKICAGFRMIAEGIEEMGTAAPSNVVQLPTAQAPVLPPEQPNVPPQAPPVQAAPAASVTPSIYGAAPAATATVSREQVIGALQQLAQAKGPQAPPELLRGLGLVKLSETPAERFPEVLAAAQAALNG